jgi:endonuclease/exonuclease/phosphatase family metal-dependent hydrolase
MRIVTYNIHSGVGVDKVHSYARIGQFLASQNVDVALIQEMDTRPPERSIEEDVEQLCAGHFTQLISSPALQESSGWYGNAVLSRYPVLSKRTLDVSQSGFQPRNIQEVVLDTSLGPLRVINTHKGLKKQERRKQFALLAEYLREKMGGSQIPIVLGGDFNEWQFMTKAFKDIHQVLNETPVRATFPVAWPLFRLDRMWTSFDLKRREEQHANISSISASVLKTSETRQFSDHYPILLDIAPRQQPVT